MVRAARILGLTATIAVLAGGAFAQSADPSAKPPSAADWAALAKLPDWGGVWVPDVSDQMTRMKTDPVPWTPDAARQVAVAVAEEKAGSPRGIFVNCLPEAMPAWMLVSHNALEFLFTPGRVTMLGESDGNRLRRVYTDGRPHPEDPDPTFHGHSIGHWEGQTLVIDTVGVLPQALIAISEAVAMPNNGGMHVVERIHLREPDVMVDDLEITAPKVLSQTWKTSRLYYRKRGRDFDLIEGVCLQGSYSEQTDKYGNAIFVHNPDEANGNPVPFAERKK